MSITKIQYVIFQKIEKNNFLVDNHMPENRIFGDLRYYPVDLLQFKPNFDYFDHVKSKDQNGLQALIFPINELESSGAAHRLVSILTSIKRVVVFLFTKECLDDIKLIFPELNKSGIRFWYYSIYAPDEQFQVKGQRNCFLDYADFYRLLKRDSKLISKYIGSNVKSLKDVQFKMPEKSHGISDYLNFRPMVNNVLNIYRSESYTFLNNHVEWDRAPVEGRQRLMLQSLKDLDDIHLEWGSEKQLSPRRSLPTLIMIFPFINPLIRKALKGSDSSQMSRILLTEQTLDYTHNITREDDEDEEEIKELLEMTARIKGDTFDGLGYLHSSFQFSPVLRFPLRASEINADLALFSVGKRTGTKVSKSRHRSIRKLGAKMNNTYLEAELEKYLAERNGQILVVSDLPIEWMLINGCPLGFRNDVCRIQDSYIQGFMNNYSLFSKINMHLGEDCVSRTLVIFSDNPDDRAYFANCIELAEAYRKDLDFKIGFASSPEDIKALLDLHRPQILIFDCHCEYDQQASSCYLKVGGSRIYSKDIREHGLAAPIIYLASCNTNPNYDNLEKLHDAFFNAGTFTITGTFLPIDMFRGTFVYLRMLKLLSSKNERYASGNWLHFVSFSIRTSLIWEAKLKCILKLGRDLNEAEEGAFITLLEELHSFEGRNVVYQQLLTGNLKLSEDIKLTIEDTEAEFLCYTHYGRPDLILFSS